MRIFVDVSKILTNDDWLDTFVRLREYEELDIYACSFFLNEEEKGNTNEFLDQHFDINKNKRLFIDDIHQGIPGGIQRNDIFIEDDRNLKNATKLNYIQYIDTQYGYINKTLDHQEFEEEIQLQITEDNELDHEQDQEEIENSSIEHFIKENSEFINEPIDFKKMLTEGKADKKTVIVNMIAKNEDFSHPIRNDMNVIKKVKDGIIRWKLAKEENLPLGSIQYIKISDNLYVANMVVKKQTNDQFINKAALDFSLNNLSESPILKDAEILIPVDKKEMGDISQVDVRRALKKVYTQPILTFEYVPGHTQEKSENIDIVNTDQQEIQPSIENPEPKKVVEIDYSKFNSKQIDQLKDAIRKNLDISRLANPDYDEWKMLQLKIAMLHDIDLFEYADTFNSYQLKELRLAKESNLDITPMLDEELKSWDMKKYRELMMAQDTKELDKFLYTKKNKEQEREKYKQMLEEIKSYPILAYAEEIGLTPKRIGKYYTLEENDSVRIKPKENTFVRYSVASLNDFNKGRGSIIDFVMTIDPSQPTYEEAVEILKKHLDINYQSLGESYSYKKYADMIDLNYVETKVEEIELPEQKILKNGMADNQKAISYLTDVRKISPEVVNEFINKKMLYQDKFNNCVFVTYDDNDKPNFACKRGTNINKRFVQDLEGCDYSEGFYIDRQSNTLNVCEAVIEVMSLMSLKYQKNENYCSVNSVYKLSSVLTHLKRHPEIDTLNLCFNNDQAGRVANEAIRKKLEEDKWHGKIVDYYPPKNYNDWNDYLVARTQIKEKNAEENKKYQNEITQQKKQHQTVDKEWVK